MKILVIQQKMIGDVLTTSILFEAIKAEHPKSELHYVINSHTFAVVEHNPFIDKFLFVTPEIEDSRAKFLSFLKGVKKEKYDVGTRTHDHMLLGLPSKPLSQNKRTRHTQAGSDKIFFWGVPVN